MKILLVNYNDKSGGSAKSAYRLHRALRRLGEDSQMLVSLKERDDDNILRVRSPAAGLFRRTQLAADKLPLLFYPQRRLISFSTQWLPNGLARQIGSLTPDIVNLHWVGHGMLRIEDLGRLPQPLVWTMHDVWPFTGGCHVNLDCRRFQEACGQCPQLDSDKSHDLSRWVWRRKRESWKNLEITLIAPSRWMATAVKSSPLFPKARVELIPHGVDTRIYRPLDKKKIRDELGLPNDKQLILFGAASDGRHKGFNLLIEALGNVSLAVQKETELIQFGPGQAKKLEPGPWRIHVLGNVGNEEKLAQLYAAADISVVPSLQESFGLVALESLACGTPVVAFATTGLLDMVKHQQNGYLAQPFESDDLARGIRWALDDQNRLRQMGMNARETVEQEFELSLQAERYLSLYRDLRQ